MALVELIYIRDCGGQSGGRDVKIEGELRDGIVAQLADPDCRRIIGSTLKESKTALEMGVELNLPTSTLYRKLAELRRYGLLMVERIVVKEDGKREAAYACTFKEISVKPGEKEVELELVLTDRGMEKKWFELFFSKPASRLPEKDGAASESSSKA